MKAKPKPKPKRKARKKKTAPETIHVKGHVYRLKNRRVRVGASTKPDGKVYIEWQRLDGKKIVSTKISLTEEAALATAQLIIMQLGKEEKWEG